MTESARKLVPRERQTLLWLARRSLETAFEGVPLEESEFEDRLTDALREPRGSFVTLHREGRLRGCIGNIRSASPLFQTVIQNARHAAFEDFRFAPLMQLELEAVEIEISALTPMLRTTAPLEDMEVGRHGVLLQLGSRTGVFLPQVAPEQGWDVKTTLRFLCRKAGVDDYAWERSDAHLWLFEAEVFEESPSQ